MTTRTPHAPHATDMHAEEADAKNEDKAKKLVEYAKEIERDLKVTHIGFASDGTGLVRLDNSLILCFTWFEELSDWIITSTLSSTLKK